MSTEKQMNIRDSEIHQLASRYAKAMGTTRKEAVRAALKAFVPPQQEPLRDPEQELWRAEILALTNDMAKDGIKRSHAQDDADLYDENGLPK